ncbi:MAG: hypothetical protein U0V02_06315 [Anaerolineales bacterium]
MTKKPPNKVCIGRWGLPAGRAHIPSIFLRLSIFHAGRLRRPYPSAGILYEDDGASRWLASCKI